MEENKSYSDLVLNTRQALIFKKCSFTNVTFVNSATTELEKQQQINDDRNLPAQSSSLNPENDETEGQNSSSDTTSNNSSFSSISMFSPGPVSRAESSDISFQNSLSSCSDSTISQDTTTDQLYTDSDTELVSENSPEPKSVKVRRAYKRVRFRSDSSSSQLSGDSLKRTRSTSKECKTQSGPKKARKIYDSDDEIEEKFRPPPERPKFLRTERTETKYDLRVVIKKRYLD